jgi:hypothetical protein
VNVVDDWFKSSVNGALTDVLLDTQSMMFDLLEPAQVRTLLDDHRSGRHDYHKLLFSLAMVEQWLRHVRPIGTEPVFAN